MNDDERPIQLEYKTPEKGEPVTAWMVIMRVIAGFFGIITLVIAIVLTALAIQWLFDINPLGRDKRGIALLPVYFAIISWIFAITSLKYAIVGDRKPRQLPFESNE